MALELMNQPQRDDDQDDQDDQYDQDDNPPDPATVVCGPAQQYKSPLAGISDEIWHEVCVFFQLKYPTAAKHKITGFYWKLFDYQLVAVWRLLANPIEEGVNGLILGDEPGLGKTVEILLFLLVRAKLIKTWALVQRNWDRGKLGGHLPRDNNGGTCFRQRTLLVQCPCVGHSFSRHLVTTYLMDLPVLLVIPPSLCKTWLWHALKAYLEPYLRFATMVSNETKYTIGDRDTAKCLAYIRRTKGKVLSSAEFAELEQRVCIAKGQGDARDVAILSEKGFRKFRKMYDNQNGISVYVAGVVVLDEFQHYKGSTGTRTEPFQEIYELQKMSRHPLTLVPLCGTLLEERPRAWNELVAHFRRQWARWGPTGSKQLRMRHPRTNADWTSEAGFLKTREAFAKMVKGVAKRPPDREELERNRQLVNGFLAPIARCLRGRHEYRQRVLMPLPKLTLTTNKLQTRPNDASMRALVNLMQSVSTLFERKLRQERDLWAAKPIHERGEMPTKESTLLNLCSSGQKLEGRPGESFTNLQRCSMYPTLAALLQDKVITSSRLAADQCLPYATKTRKAVEDSKGEEEEKVEKALVTVSGYWELYPHLQTIFESSAKLAFLKDLIQRMRYDRTKARSPADGSGVQHAIIFCQTPIAAVLTYLGLLRDAELRMHTDILWLTSGVKAKDRDSVIEDMNKDLKPGAHHKILVTTVSVGAEGFNVQRANNVWFPEFPVTLGAFYQAQCRAWRQGQKMEVDVQIVQEEVNWMETLGWASLDSLGKVVGLLDGTNTVEQI